MGAFALFGVAVALTVAKGDERNPEPLQIVVQVGGTRTVQLDAEVQRASVARPSVALVETGAGGGVIVRGLAVGRTLVVLWTAAGRQILVVSVEAAPSVRADPQSDFRNPQFRDGTTLHVYQGSVNGSAPAGGGVRYGSMQHSFSSSTSFLAGSASANVAVTHAGIGEPARLAYLAMRYRDPLFDLELGDVGVGTLTMLGSVPQVRGGLASYHDGKYRLSAFGGVLRREGRSFYELAGPVQTGVQTQFFPAENLTLGLQAVRTAFEDARPAQLTLSPAAHWVPIPSLMFDGEGALHNEGGALRLRAAFDAPLGTANAVYQMLGPNFTGLSSRSDLGQLTLVLTPSAYYQLMGLVGRTVAGGHLMAPSPPGYSTFYESGAQFYPRGGASLTRFSVHFADSDGRQQLAAGGYQRHTRNLEGSLQSALGDTDAVYQISAHRRDTSVTSIDATGTTEARQEALGGRAMLHASFAQNRLRAGVDATYERHISREAGATVRSTLVGTGLSAGVRAGFLFFDATGQLSREYFGSRVAETFGGSVMLALRPTAAHELRGQVQFWKRSSRAGIWDWPDELTPEQYAGSLSYTHFFGSAADGPGLFDFIVGSRVSADVFLDADEDGVRDPDESGVAGVVAWLDGEERSESDGSGRLSFGRVEVGNHVMRVDPQSLRGLKFTTASVVSLSVRRDDDAHIEIGVSDRAQIFGFVFNDANLDGEYQEGEPGVDGVHVTLVGEGETAAVSAGGSFSFGGLAPGAYTIRVDMRSIPVNFIWRNGSNGNGNGNGHGTNGHGANGDGKGHDANGRNGTNGNGKNGNGKGIHVELDKGGVSAVRIPLWALRTVEGRIFLDRDRDGKFTSVDQPAAGVTLRIKSRQVVTDAEGRYLFRNVPAGRLELAVDPVTLPRGRMLMSPGTVELQLPAAPTSEQVDFILGGAR